MANLKLSPGHPLMPLGIFCAGSAFGSGAGAIVGYAIGDALLGSIFLLVAGLIMLASLVCIILAAIKASKGEPSEKGQKLGRQSIMLIYLLVIVEFIVAMFFSL